MFGSLNRLWCPPSFSFLAPHRQTRLCPRRCTSSPTAPSTAASGASVRASFRAFPSMCLFAHSFCSLWQLLKGKKLSV